MISLPLDWDFYTEKLRAEYYPDANQLRPYFELDNVLTRGVFYAAERPSGFASKSVTNCLFTRGCQSL